jgi:hypothetical protein
VIRKGKGSKSEGNRWIEKEKMRVQMKRRGNVEEKKRVLIKKEERK